MKKLSFAKVSLIVITAGALVSGCGNNNDNAAVRQVAARVNGKDITIYQLKNEYAALSGPAAAAKPLPTRQVLDSLIDEQLLIEQSKERKLDHNPQVIQAEEKARRQIMVRALQDNLGASLPQPTPAEIRTFYEKNEALFSKRRIYTFRQFTVERAAFSDGLKSKLDQAKSQEAVTAALKSENTQYRELVYVRPAEQVPMSALSAMVNMNRGDIVVVNDTDETMIMQVMDFVDQPATLEQATPVIREYLLNSKKSELVANMLKTLRNTAKIEYVGNFAKDDTQTAQTPAASSRGEKSAQSANPTSDATAKSNPAGEKQGSKIIEADKDAYIRSGMQAGKI